MFIEIAGLWIIFLVFVAASFWLFRVRLTGKTIITWPQVKATVVSESIVFQRTGWFFSDKMKGLRISSIEYEYAIDGCTHRSRKLLPVNWTIRESERERVQRELETFAVAFCNPTDSAEAFLDIPDRWQRGSISWITVGLIVAVLMSGLVGRMLLSRYV